MRLIISFIQLAVNHIALALWICLFLYNIISKYFEEESGLYDFGMEKVINIFVGIIIIFAILNIFGIRIIIDDIKKEFIYNKEYKEYKKNLKSNNILQNLLQSFSKNDLKISFKLTIVGMNVYFFLISWIIIPIAYCIYSLLDKILINYFEDLIPILFILLSLFISAILFKILSHYINKPVAEKINNK
ncbi:MAG: hypothetical protein AB1765_12725 [Candidatus Hydrogenedentota bacterium]